MENNEDQQKMTIKKTNEAFKRDFIRDAQERCVTYVRRVLSFYVGPFRATLQRGLSDELSDELTTTD